MISSMFLGVFAGMLSRLVASLFIFKWGHGQDVDLDKSSSLAKNSMFLLTMLLICLGAASDYVVGDLAISAYTLFGMFAFVVADEFVNSTSERFAAQEVE